LENSCACSENICTDFDVFKTDSDNDGFDIICDLDCDDSNSDVNPGEEEICDGIDNNCDGEIDEDLFNNDFRLSYSTRHTGDVIFINGFDEFTFERIDFFHGYVHKARDGGVDGFGSMVARGTLPDGRDINLNVKFDVTELLEESCDHITWRNSARGTFWIEGIGPEKIEFDFMDVTYYILANELDAEGFGDIDFKLEDMFNENSGIH